MRENAEAVLEVVKGIIDAAGCASLITVDEVDIPSSRPVRTFPSDDKFTTITIPSDVNSRKTRHVANNSKVLLAYVDTPSRGYVTMYGNGEIVDHPEEKRAAWLDAFSAFWPDGPESKSYTLIVVRPEKIETRSYTQGIADNPTHWTPVVLIRSDDGGWTVAGS